jgi:hypothetical protein
LDVELPNFKLDDFEFNPKNILNEDVFLFFEKYEFNSLIWNEWIAKLQTWKDLWLKVHIIDNDENLKKLKETCVKEKKFVLDTETTSLNIMVAELVWISIYIDDEKIYYINRLHSWNKVSDWALQEFVKSILSSDSLIIWHNLKYDLEILDLFLKNLPKQQKQDEFLRQISFNF